MRPEPGQFGFLASTANLWQKPPEFIFLARNRRADSRENLAMLKITGPVAILALALVIGGCGDHDHDHDHDQGDAHDHSSCAHEHQKGPNGLDLIEIPDEKGHVEYGIHREYQTLSLYVLTKDLKPLPIQETPVLTIGDEEDAVRVEGISLSNEQALWSFEHEALAEGGATLNLVLPLADGKTAIELPEPHKH